MKKLKQRIISAVVAALMAIIPEAAFASGEQTDDPVHSIEVTCLTEGDIRPGDTVLFQAVYTVTGSDGDGVDDTVITVTWDDGFEPVGEPEVCEGYGLSDITVSGNSMSFTLETYFEDYEMYVPGVLIWENGREDVTVTYSLKISETASGTLGSTVSIDGSCYGSAVHAEDTISLVMESGEDPDDPGSDDPDEPSQEPNWYLKRISEESTQTSFSVTFRIMQREEEA